MFCQTKADRKGFLRFLTQFRKHEKLCTAWRQELLRRYLFEQLPPSLIWVTGCHCLARAVRKRRDCVSAVRERIKYSRQSSERNFDNGDRHAEDSKKP